MTKKKVLFLGASIIISGALFLAGVLLLDARKVDTINQKQSCIDAYHSELVACTNEVKEARLELTRGACKSLGRAYPCSLPQKATETILEAYKTNLELCYKQYDYPCRCSHIE